MIFSFTFLKLIDTICKYRNCILSVLPCTNWKNANPFELQDRSQFTLMSWNCRETLIGYGTRHYFF